MTVCALEASNTQRGVYIPISGALTLVSRAQPSPQQAFGLCVDSLFPPAAELLCLNNPAASCWHFCVVSFPSDRLEPGKLNLKRREKKGSLHSICFRVCPSTCIVWPLPSQPCSCTNKGVFLIFTAKLKNMFFLVLEKKLLLWNFQPFIPACTQFWAEIEEIWDDPGERTAETSA